MLSPLYHPVAYPGDATEFKPARDQRQALHRWSRFVLGEQYQRESARLHPKTKQEKARSKTYFDLLHTIHECESAQLQKPPDPAHQFDVTLESNDFTEEKYELFENYQRIVHNEPPSKISPNGFKRFLCSSPLKAKSVAFGQGCRKLGSYHQCYRLDGRLVAIGVVDLLPQCVSGVYFIYHDDMNRWNFGKVGALREAALALEDGYRYYYMGFYIHSCVKMRYKGDYHPQYMLDPETYTWNILDSSLKRRLDASKYVSLSKERASGVSTPPPAGDSFPDFTTKSQSFKDGDVSDVSEVSESEGIQDDDEGGDELSLFDASMPGTMALEEVMEKVDLGNMTLQVGNWRTKAKVLLLL
ncbi:MAG: Arginyl-tRNA--protein transferase 1 [Caeruleum heppii]|nr:MAG: Arginyl-tRNA--protein transferase 1 [Caeruleum heppii]